MIFYSMKWDTIKILYFCISIHNLHGSIDLYFDGVEFGINALIHLVFFNLPFFKVYPYLNLSQIFPLGKSVFLQEVVVV